MRVAAYVRVSSEDQDTENQRADIEALAERNGWTIGHWYTEVESSVKVRPVYEQMMRDAEAHRFDALVIWALDRLGRSMTGNVAAFARLADAGVRVASVHEAWLDQPGPTRGLLISIFSWIAEQERLQIVARTKVGMAKARKLGTRSGLPIGRPRRNDAALDRAVAAVSEGMAVRAAAKACNVPHTTLQRRLTSTRKGVDGTPS